MLLENQFLSLRVDLAEKEGKSKRVVFNDC